MGLGEWSRHVPSGSGLALLLPERWRATPPQDRTFGEWCGQPPPINSCSRTNAPCLAHQEKAPPERGQGRDGASQPDAEAHAQNSRDISRGGWFPITHMTKTITASTAMYVVIPGRNLIIENLLRLLLRQAVPVPTNPCRPRLACRAYPPNGTKKGQETDIIVAVRGPSAKDTPLPRQHELAAPDTLGLDGLVSSVYSRVRGV